MAPSVALHFPSPCISTSRSFPAQKGKSTVRCSAETTKPASVINIIHPHRNNSYFNAGFPPGFCFGAASAAYQVEGATKEGGRGQSIWDAFCEKYPEKIADRSNGEPGAGSYYLYEKDIELLKDLDVSLYRFSISWSRILPTGHGEPNEEGIKYYNKLIDELLNNGIAPFVTLFHWDQPQALEDEYGSFLCDKIVDDFKHFADICFKNFGDRVKHWLTLNEPSTYCNGGYSLGVFAPGHCTPGLVIGGQDFVCPVGDSIREPYIVAHNLLKAHAEVVKLYRDNYQTQQRGKIGITLVSNWFVPYTNHPLHIEAQKRALEFSLGWFLDPIKFGDYPFSMKSLARERLPEFTKKESDKLKNSYDFIGINYYTSAYAKNKGFDLNAKPIVYGDDMRVDTPESKNGIPIGYVEENSWVFVYPAGLKALLLYVKERYNNPEIFITENGVEQVTDELKIVDTPAAKDDPHLLDQFRSQYQAIHLHELVEALRLGVNLKGYFVWSLLDSFEWKSGYTSKFGLVHDNNGPFKPYDKLVREPKDSFKWYKWFISVARTPKPLENGSPPSIAKSKEVVAKDQHYEELEEEEEVTVQPSITPTRVLAGQ